MPRRIKADLLIEDVRGQVRGSNDFRVRHDHKSLDEILKLAHVSFPAVIHQVLKRFGVNPLLLYSELLAKLSDEMPCQQGNILSTLAQRRQMNRNYMDAIIKVFAKAMLSDGLLQILVGRSD